MPDVFSRKKRSEIMSRIRSKNTTIERLVFGALREHKIRFSRHYLLLPGRPDIVIKEKKVAVFIDGDFWHGYRFPAWRHKISKGYWREKIEANRLRDRKNRRRIRGMGWRVLRIWEHELKKKPASTLERFIKTLADLHA